MCEGEPLDQASLVSDILTISYISQGTFQSIISKSMNNGHFKLFTM